LAILSTPADNTAGAVSTVLDLPGYDAYPTISPDGQQVAFISDWNLYDILYHLFVAPIGNPAAARTVQPEEFLSGRWEIYLNPAWSPDGTAIAVSACLPAWGWCDGDAWLAVVDVANGGLVAIARTNAMADPSWSADGNWIAYSSKACPTAAPCVKMIPRWGGSETMVITNAQDPAWRP
jgi:Tol biopolymer transport system component